MNYFRYWGKARAEAGGEPCHLLPFHCLDVAAVGWHLLAPERPLSRHLASRLGLDPVSLRTLLVFALGVHDLGKFARSFQSVAHVDGVELVPPVARFTYSIEARHDRLGAALWGDNFVDWARDGALGDCPLPEGRREKRAAVSVMGQLMAPMFGHHGVPVQAGNLNVDAHFAGDETSDDVLAAKAFVADWAALLQVYWPLERMQGEDFARQLAQASWVLAGWAVLSDWVGSNRDWFAYRSTPMALEDYWLNEALPRAQQALDAVGLAESPRPLAYAGLTPWFSAKAVTPTPLQAAAETLALADGPQLYILEDVTGAGKTEAACILAQRLLHAGHGEGLYFALPTMATSNAMYQRMGPLHRHFFHEDSRPSLVLAHGAREINDDFARALGTVQPREHRYSREEDNASAQCNRWLGDSRKKALLADVGVGTIDQALSGVLRYRHQSLRLYGLARKVLIVDEVHAYDVYMQTLLHELLRHHARMGGSAILLTATLPLASRQALVHAWSEEVDGNEREARKTDFPLLTTARREGVEEIPIDTRPEVEREVALQWLSEEGEAIEAVLAAVDAGECVAWVRNTVDDALRAFDVICQRHPDPERCQLFHSRFAMQDRQRIESDVIQRLGKHSTAQERAGRVIIATQVFQESLDCDVDLMISDLAPVDLLIQRAGRLQRHQRVEPRRAPTLMVLAPKWTDEPDALWLGRALPGTQAVYSDTSLCWLTQKVLRERGAIRMPGEARALIEGVYGASTDEVPDELHQARLQRKGGDKSAGNMASFNMLALNEGYGDDSDWSSELELGTRLSDEPSVNLALVERVDGELRLYAHGERHAAMLSQLRLRQSQAKRLADLPETWMPQWQSLVTQYPALRFIQPWLVGGDSDADYSASRGLVFLADGRP